MNGGGRRDEKSPGRVLKMGLIRVKRGQEVL